MAVLDIGDLFLKVGGEFKLEGKVLTVPHFCNLEQIAAFLESAGHKPTKAG